MWYPVRQVETLAQPQGQGAPSQGTAHSIAAKIALQRGKKGSDLIEHVLEMAVANKRIFCINFCRNFQIKFFNFLRVGINKL